MDDLGSHPEIGNYILLETIGSGSYGKVKIGEDKIMGTKVAIKIIKKSLIEAKKDVSIKIKREIGLMRLFNHPHLLKLIDVLESSRHLYIILEYAAHGELFDFLQDQTSLSVESAIRLFRQIIYGLEFLHSHSICHRDIKPENILLDSHDNIKIADFGFSRWMKDNIAATACGSPHYTAPEIIIGLPYDGRAADIWSCGVVFYTLMCGRLPFDEPTVRKLLQRVKSGKFSMPDLPDDIKDLIQRMLTVDPKKRITLAEIKKHPAFRIGLAPLYVCPTPQPIPDNLPPVDIKSVKEADREVLYQLGFQEEELEDQLNTEEQTAAKGFIYMLRGLIQFDSIKWEITTQDESPLMLTVREKQEVHHTMSTSMSLNFSEPSVASFSVVERSILAGDKEDMFKGAEKRITNTQSPVETLMNALQTHLTEQGFKWVHPDDFMLLARNDSYVPPFDVAIDTVPLDETFHSVEVTLASPTPVETFDALVAEIQSIIDSLVF